ncbi:hypothetical protein tinsulaeT_37120 [Thalassotalea insulae]|uniref:ImpA N-terminal domain-containing protein n=1 Tax=Thalassotalea insulae TaxID=2056778 RepID=A0ABQ6H0M3_9GAMM|nr:type VI secretion system protein TssA [Thalassotalea insulae]GLX80372.1 hypothetical protein tinsulaeT_37120 [Thalassotalea insulae]
MRLRTAEQQPDEYMQYHMGYSLEDLMSPIGEDGVGESVRHNGVYSTIKAARKFDDPTLPVGVWEKDLKTADWSQVKNAALEALANKSKDLQLGIWLFEASLHLEGFAGIAPAALLVQQLCEHYWDNMYPQMMDGDVEFRTNPLSWINTKLTPVIKTLPLTLAKLDGGEVSWNDWEAAQYTEKLLKQKQLKNIGDRLTVDDFKQRILATESEHFFNLVTQIEDALMAIDYLQNWLDQKCGDDSPGFGDMTGVLNEITQMMISELERRGISMAPASDNNAEGGDKGEGQHGAGGGGGDSGEGATGPLTTREDAFAALRRAADFLIKDDPHSMVPYLVYTACDWGKQSAPALYQEVFLSKQGQINVFEMMGIEK